MNCPPEVADVLLSIMKTALLRIRQAGWSKAPQRCAIEADHVHNLPDLLSNYSPELLKFYWEVERPAFVSQSETNDRAAFDPLWARLACHVEGKAETSATR